LCGSTRNCLPQKCTFYPAFRLIFVLCAGETLKNKKKLMSVVLEGLSKSYGAQRAIDRVSFEARPGEILGFLGPNGAGKTTTMKIIAGYLAATEGKVRVCGIDVGENSLEVRRRLGYLPEHNPLYKDMYVKEYLAFVARIHKLRMPAQRIGALIEQTGLTLERNKPIRALSKGYRQRVGLAQALMHDPEVLILDEPTTGLDPNQLSEIRALIRSLGKSKTLIFSTHIMQEVEAVCDRAIIINKGEIVADEPINQLKQRLQGGKAVTVQWKTAPSAGLIEKIAGVTRYTALGGNRFRLFAGTDNDLREEVFNWSVAHQYILLEMQQESSSLEDIFQQLTRQSPVNTAQDVSL
jgi:ABC-2 type transport system ATP-binding protein